MTDTNQNENLLTKHTAMKLAECALNLRHSLVDHEIAKAFISVGMQMAVYAHGNMSAAEWLRDVADEIEREPGPQH